MLSTTAHAWTPGPDLPPPPHGAVHVWRADLTTVADEVGEVLCPEERARALQIRSTRHRHLWARSRGVLRSLLARYVGSDPGALCFTTGAHGKPSLDPADAASGAAEVTPRVSFNLSHSGELALYAVTDGGAVGVDVERAHRPIDALAVAARAFGPVEAARLAALDPVTREREFLRAWVRHEAELKCRGTGIGGGAAPIGSRRPWIAQLELGAGAAGAVATDVAPATLCRWDWPPGPIRAVAPRGSSR
jgi:4'-phosphopantetheinyl transferase